MLLTACMNHLKKRLSTCTSARKQDYQTSCLPTKLYEQHENTIGDLVLNFQDVYRMMTMDQSSLRIVMPCNVPGVEYLRIICKIMDITFVTCGPVEKNGLWLC
jgi:hypothetical protein